MTGCGAISRGKAVSKADNDRRGRMGLGESEGCKQKKEERQQAEILHKGSVQGIGDRV